MKNGRNRLPAHGHPSDSVNINVFDKNGISSIINTRRDLLGEPFRDGF